MKTLKNIIFSSLFLTLFLACSNESADIESPVEPEVIEAYQAINVSYGSDANQVFDIYLPENRTESTKTLILVHGGS